MKQHPLIDNLDQLQQRRDAQTSMVPAIGVPAPGRQGHEGPPGHSSKAPVFFCGTGVGLLTAKNIPNPKSDSLSREQEPVGFALADPEIRRLAHGGHYDLRGSLSPHLFLGCGCVLFKDGRRDESRCEAFLPGNRNPADHNPTVSRHETGCYYCGSEKPADRLYCCDACYTEKSPEPKSNSAFRDPPGTWNGERWVATEPYETHEEWVARLEREGRAPYEEILATAAPERSNLPSRLHDADETTPLDYGFLLPMMRNTAIGPSASNLAAKVEERRAAFSKFSDALCRDGIALKAAYPPLIVIPASQTPPAGRVFTFRMPEYVPEEGEWLTECGRRELQERMAGGLGKIAAMGTVAGHVFEGVGSDGKCSCGRYREDLRPRTREWIGTHGHAHVGELTEHEYRQIEEMFTEEERIWSHVEGVSSGR